jgi:hypothetical protein
MNLPISLGGMIATSLFEDGYDIDTLLHICRVAVIQIRLMELRVNQEHQKPSQNFKSEQTWQTGVKDA